jgi:hypothetical protein
MARLLRELFKLPMRKAVPRKKIKNTKRIKNTRKAKVSTPKSDPDRWRTTEEALTRDLSEDFLDAWKTLRRYAADLGPQRIYASGKAIIFAKKVAYFFVRPKTKFLEVVVFLREGKPLRGFASAKPVSKTKYAHTYKLIHSDQVEDTLTAAISAAYRATE